MVLNNPSFSIDRWERRRAWGIFAVDVPIFRLEEPLRFTSKINGAGDIEITVPAGETTDLASIPPELWSVLPPTGRWALPAVLHDYLYRLPDVSRFLADALFREAMQWSGVSAGKRLLIYYAVRFLGARYKRRGG